MSTAELLLECKNGLGISPDSTAFDGILTQKILVVQLFMTNAGVPASEMDNPLAAGTVVMGVNDLWDLKSGEVKFSPVFFTLVSQLAAG